MSWKRRIGWAALGAVILVLGVLIGGYFYLKSSSFERYALSQIMQQADAATGAKTTIGRIDFSLSKLTANMYDITLHGTEGADELPLLHADKLTVRVKILSAFRHQVSLRELLLVHPVVHIQVSRDGISNLPTAPPSQNSSHTSVFDLAVEHAQLTNGEVNYKERKTPLNVDFYDLTTDVRFNSVPQRYDGSLFYRNGHLTYGNRSPLPHDLDLWFSATPDRLNVRSAVLRVGSSNISLQAEVANYSNPVADGKYQIRIHTQDFAEFTSGTRPCGDVLLTGNLHYHAVANRPSLRDVSLDGRFASEALAAAVSGRKLEVKHLDGQYRLAGGNLHVSNLHLESLGGRLVSNAEIRHLDSTPESRIHASLTGISLRALQSISGAQGVQNAVLSGTVSGKVDAESKGGMNTLNARSDLIVNGHAESTANSSATEVPVNGVIHVAYDRAHGTIAVRDTTLHIPSASLMAQGTVGHHSQLELRLVADDLHQLAVLVSSFRPGQTTPPAVSGEAVLTAVVQGSMNTPTIEGQLSAHNLQVEGSEWSRAQITLHADPSRLTVSNGTVVNAHRGQAAFSASVQLHDWSYQAKDPLQARLDTRQLRLTDLMALAKLQYPVSGEVTAKLSLSGSQLDPSGSGQLEIADVNVYGEPLDRVVTNIHTENGSIATTMTATAKAGTIHADLSYAPKTRAYKVRVDAPGIILQKLSLLQAKNIPITGTANAFVNGEGTLDDPQLVAIVQLPRLQAQGQTISEMKAEARVAQHRLDWSLDSKVSQVYVHGYGQVALTGDYDCEASVDTGTVSIGALLAAVGQNVPGEFQGQTELHATVKGPLKDPSRMEGHLSIPVLKASYESLQVGITHPILADYSNSIVTLQPADVEGTGTSLQFQGRIPMKSQSAPTLTAHGTVDLRIVRIVAPNVSSGGTIALDVHSSASAGNLGVEGQLQLKNVAVTTADAPIGIEQLNGTLNILNDRLQVSQMKGQIGGGQVTFGGSITYWPSLRFHIATQSQSVRLLYPAGLRTLLDANLAFTGTTAESSLNGRVLIDSLSFTPEFDLAQLSDQFSTGETLSQPGFADNVHLAIAVQSRENLNATSSQVSIEGRAALQIGGTAANPVITGRTTLTSGELFYRSVRYQLQRGMITFDDPNQTHPVLNLSVGTTIEQYNLTLALRGPLDKVTTSYTSDPPLATADIINLVARGKTTQESAASTQSTDSMIASQAASQLSSSVQKLAGISSLQIDPTLGNQNPSARVAIQQRVTKNLLFGFSTDVSQPGSETVQGEYQINKRWSVSMTRDQLGGVSVDGRYHIRF